jgi:hypothetical protein
VVTLKDLGELPESSNGRKRATKPKRSERIEAWPPPPPPKAEPDSDELVDTTEAAIIRLLHADIEAKDMNAAIANAIRLIQVKNRIKPDAEPKSYWDAEGDE